MYYRLIFIKTNRVFEYEGQIKLVLEQFYHAFNIYFFFGTPLGRHK